MKRRRLELEFAPREGRKTTRRLDFLFDGRPSHRAADGGNDNRGETGMPPAGAPAAHAPATGDAPAIAAAEKPHSASGWDAPPALDPPVAGELSAVIDAGTAPEAAIALAQDPGVGESATEPPPWLEPPRPRLRGDADEQEGRPPEQGSLIAPIGGLSLAGLLAVLAEAVAVLFYGLVAAAWRLPTWVKRLG